MPVCAGRPVTGQCPNNASDITVNCSFGDLLLCQECYDYRVTGVPNAVVSDNTVNMQPELVVNELLFYATGKFCSQTANNLRLVLSSFYTNEEVAVAKELLHNAVSKCNAVGVSRYNKKPSCCWDGPPFS